MIRMAKSLLKDTRRAPARRLSRRGHHHGPARHPAQGRSHSRNTHAGKWGSSSLPGRYQYPRFQQPTHLSPDCLFSSDEAPTDATLGDSAYVKAFLILLDTSHFSGDAVDLTATTTTEVEAAIGGNRIYQYEQDDGELVQFSYDEDLGVVFLQSFRVMQLYWTIESTSPGTFNATEFEEALDGELITVAGITDSQEKPPFGNTEIEVNAMRLNMDRMRLENASDHPVIEYQDEGNKTRRLIVGIWCFDALQCELVNGAWQCQGNSKNLGCQRYPILARPKLRMVLPGYERQSIKSPRMKMIGNAHFHNRNSTYSLGNS